MEFNEKVIKIGKEVESLAELINKKLGNFLLKPFRIFLKSF